MISCVKETCVKGAIGNSIPGLLQTSSSLKLSLSVVQVGPFSCFQVQWKRITSNRFVLNMIKGHYL